MPETSHSKRARLTVRTLAVLTLGLLGSQLISSDPPKRLDPAAWGSDHVGKPVAEYVTGDECLFCHRKKIGPTWNANRHNQTIRTVDETSPALAALKQSAAKDVVKEIELVLGSTKRQRFLKRAKAYGKLDLLSVQWKPAESKEPGELLHQERPHWNVKQFAKECAGCHTTAVDPKDQAFTALALDCYACHGNVDLEHSKKPELVYLSKKRKDPARVVISICAQCHVRTGKSKSSGRPYPNNFIAGDNLFRDFQVDFSDEKINSLSTMDRHVLENVRDVVVFSKEELTCLSCHDVHGRSSKMHHRVPKSNYCLNCHNAQGPKRNLKPLTSHSKTCGY